MIRRIGTVALALGLGAAAHLVGEEAGAAKNAAGDPNELMYLPEGRVLRMASLGHRSLLADVIWLRTIQYYGEHRLTDRNYDQAERLFQVIYDLDPTFKGATRFGALVLSQDAGNPEAGLRLLGQAERDSPHTWEYPFDAGFIQQTVVRDLEAAGESYRRASFLPGAPDLAARLAGISFAKLGDRDAAREVWEELWQEGDNKMVKRLAERSLRNLDMEDAEDLLTEAVGRFREERGRFPAGWDELVASGFVPALPAEPFGGQFFLDPHAGRVWSTTHLDRRMAIQRDIIAQTASEVRARDGAYPRSIEALFEEGLIDAMPWEPFGFRLEYDPSTGRVAWNPPWPATEARNHGDGGL